MILAARFARFMAIATSASACVTPATTVIPSPPTHGTIAPNLVPQFDSERAGYYGLPSGVFADEASLVSFDERNVCFTITLRVEGDHPTLARLEGWRVYLRSDPAFETHDAHFGVPTRPMLEPMRGSVPRQQFSGYYNTCTRFTLGMNCLPQPRYTTIRQPALVTVMTGAGSVCFAHGGAINAHTRAVTLHLDAPDDFTRRIAFRWRFDP